MGGAQNFDIYIAANYGVGAKLGAFGFHLFDTSFDVLLFHLEFGDAVAQQPADAIRSLEHEHFVASTR